jgi:Holliday junction resolvasome RuvABC endonuclease subunit
LMVQRLLKLKDVPRPHDAADGIAVALCHCYRGFGVNARTPMRFSLELLRQEGRRP